MGNDAESAKIGHATRTETLVQRRADAGARSRKIGHFTLTDQLVQRSAAGAADLRDFQRVLQLLRSDAPPSEDASEVHAIAAHGVAGASSSLPHRDAIQAAFGRHDVTGVRSQVGGDAADASRAIGAQAYAVGDRIAFAGAPDLHTAAHEAAHVVQQRRGIALEEGVGQEGDAYERHADAVADAVVAGRSAEPLLDEMAGKGAGAAPAEPALQRKTDPEHFHATANDSGGGSLASTAQSWMWTWSPMLVARLDAWLASTPFVLTSPFVRWRSGSSKEFASAMWAPIRALTGKGQHYATLRTVLAPDAIDMVINAGRDAAVYNQLSPIDDSEIQARGAFEWREGVVDEFGKFLLKRIIESLARIVPRWLVSKNQLALAAEGGNATTDRDPARGEVAPSHPIDPYVVEGLAGNVVVDLPAYRAANPDQRVKGDVAALGKVRAVTFEWQHDRGAWNWLRVKEAGATKEDVAFTLYGDAAFAHTLTDASPLFGFANTEDLSLEVRDATGATYWEKADQAKQPPRAGDDDEIPVPEQQAQGGALGDEVALNQSASIVPTVQATEAGRLAIVERMRGALQLFERILAESARFPAGGYPSLLTAAMQRLEARAHRINDKATSVADAVLWDGQSQSQVDLLNSALNGVVMANAQFTVFASWPNSRVATQQLGFQYLEVACLSEMASSARDELASANEASKLFPVTLAELLLAEVRKALHTQGGSKDGVQSDADHDAFTGKAEHDRREAKLRAGLAKIREKLLQNPEAARTDLKALIQELSDLQAEVSMVADLDHMATAWKALYDDLSFVGVFTGANSDDSDAMKALNALNGEFSSIYVQYRGGDKEGARTRLEQKRPEWAAMLEKIKKLIKHNETKNKWVTFGILVGIAVITAGVGAYVEGAAGAVWGASSWATFAVTTGAEALAFTSMSYLIVEKDPSISGFFLELGKNALLFGALKGIGNKFTRYLGDEAATLGGRAQTLLVQFVALNTLALGEADARKYLQTGQHLGTEEILEISKQNVLFLVATALSVRLARPGLETLKLSGAVDASLVRLRGLKGELKDLAAAIEAEKGVHFDKSKDLLAKERELLRAEEETLQKLEKLAADPKAAKKAGLDTPQMRQKLLELRAEHNATEEAMKPALVMESIEGSGGVRWVEKGKKWQEAVDFLRGNDSNKVADLVADRETGARGVEVTTEDGNTFRLVERMSAHEGVVGVTPQVGPRAPTAEEVAANQKAADDARAALKEQSAALKALIDTRPVPEFERLQIGGDAAGLMNQASLPKAAGGSPAPGSVEWPRMLTVSEKVEVWDTRGEVNQTPGELEGPGLRPSQMTTNQHGYTGARPLADAIMLGKHRSGMAIYEGRAAGAIELRGGRSGSAWPSSKQCRIKIGDKYFYADHIDIATGPGPSNTAEVTKVVPGGEKGDLYQGMVKEGRIFYGDQSPIRVVKPGGMVLVWGGSGNAAAMAEEFAAAGCDVINIARISEKAPPPQVAPEVHAIEAKLKTLPPDSPEAVALIERLNFLRAFGQEMLPRNIEKAFESDLAKQKIQRKIVAEVTKVEPVEVEENGSKVQKVRVTSSKGDVFEVDQLVVSLGQNPHADGAAGGFIKGIQLEMILTGEGDLVGLQSVEPRGAVRLLGAAFADAKLARYVVPEQRTAFQTKLAAEAARLPPNSKGVAPSIANAAHTIEAANDVLAAQTYKLPGATQSLTLQPGNPAIWPQQIATFLGGEIGVEPARITVEPVGGGKSNAPVFRIRVGAEELGYFKVFDSIGEAQTEVSMLKLLASRRLRNMEVVGDKGQISVSDGAGGTKGGILMETAKGTSVDAMVNSLPTEPALRPEAIGKLREAVAKVAKGLAEMHKAFADRDPQSLEQKTSEASYTLQKLEGIRAQVGEAHHARLRAALEVQIAAYKAAKVPATAYHGDANSGNFIIGPDGKLRVIDVGLMQWSVDGAGKPRGTGAADVARFLESLESKRPGALTPDEITQLTRLFNDTYFREMRGQVSPADLEAATAMYRAQLEISIVKSARPDAKDVVDTTYVGALGRLDHILGIPPGEFVVPLTPPSQTTTDDKKPSPDGREGK